MKHIILGTAGHIDHGKTALVKALTGVDTDRLKEEKERGITTELGFTYLDLPSGVRLGIIDVPGHEKFVKHMVAGAWGIDLVALVIAADESVMPQTREHLDICRLLKVKKGLIILTKIDLVDRDLLDLVKEEVRDTVKDTFLREAPLLCVSSVTGEGIQELLSLLDRFSNEIEERSHDGLFRLPVDRTFVMKGFGTVVTGTMVSGTLSLGETVEALPVELRGKVRNLQVYGQSVETAYAGQRTAINLQGVEAASIERGNVLVHPGTLTPTSVLDTFLEYLPGARHPLKHRAKMRFHIGTNLTMASLFLLDRDELAPGDGGFVQIRLDRPLVAFPKDRFVIRDPSAIQTLGGGVILDPHPPKHKRHSQAVLDVLRLYRDGTVEEILRQAIHRAGLEGVLCGELMSRVAVSPHELERWIDEMTRRGEILWIDQEKKRVVDVRRYQKLKEDVLQTLKAFHQRNPMKSGLAKEELRTRLPAETDMKLFQMLLHAMMQGKEVVMEKDKLRLPSHQIASIDEKGLMRRIEDSVKNANLQPPSPKELSEAWTIDENEIQAIFDHLVHEGVLIKIRIGLYFHRTAVDRIRERLIAHLKQHQELTTPQFKEMTGVSRKFAIPLIEYFDQVRLTLRLGDKRILRSASP